MLENLGLKFRLVEQNGGGNRREFNRREVNSTFQRMLLKGHQVSKGDPPLPIFSQFHLFSIAGKTATISFFRMPCFIVTTPRAKGNICILLLI